MIQKVKDAIVWLGLRKVLLFLFTHVCSTYYRQVDFLYIPPLDALRAHPAYYGINN